jgi:hypothetical protein
VNAHTAKLCLSNQILIALIISNSLSMTRMVFSILLSVFDFTPLIICIHVKSFPIPDPDFQFIEDSQRLKYLPAISILKGMTYSSRRYYSIVNK